jgi:signal transduction histidine kinase/Tfp pilus assembly protein PilF
MRIIFVHCYALFFLVHLAAYSKNDPTDSLLLLVEKAPLDTIKVNLYNKLSAFHAPKDIEKSKFYGNKALEIAKPIQYYQGVADAYFYMARSQSVHNNPTQAIVYFENALNFYKKSGDENRIASTYNNIGIVYKNRSEYQLAYEHFNYSLDYAKKYDNKDEMANAYSNIGLIFRHNGKIEYATEYFLRALQIREEIGDLKGIAIAKGNIGNLYNNQKNYDKALKYYQEAAAIFSGEGNNMFIGHTLNNIGVIYQNKKNYDSAIYYFSRAGVIFKNLNIEFGVATNLSNIAYIYREQEKYQESLESMKEALEIFRKTGNKASEALCLIDVGINLTHLNRFEEAQEYLYDGLEMAKEMKDLQKEMDGYFGLSQYYEKRKNFELAFDFQKKYSELKDSIYSKEINDKFAEIQTKFQIEKKEHENRLLREQQSKQEEIILRKELENKVLIGGIILFLLFVIYFYRINYQKKRINQLLIQQNNEINLKQQQIISINETLKKSQIQLHKANEELQRLNTGLESTIRERTYELQKSNDELDTFLYQSSHALRRPIVNIMGLVQIARLDPDKDNLTNVYLKIDDTSSRMDLMLKKLAMVSEINMTSIDQQLIDFESIMVETLASLNIFLRDKHIDFHSTIDPKIKFYSDKRLIGIIFHNLMENAINFNDKEKEAYIKIQIIDEQESIKIILKDNGIGIAKEVIANVFEMFSIGTNLSKGYGLGLYIVKKGVKKLNGQIHLFSKEGEFTQFEVFLPKDTAVKSLDSAENRKLKSTHIV